MINDDQAFILIVTGLHSIDIYIDIAGTKFCLRVSIVTVAAIYNQKYGYLMSNQALVKSICVWTNFGPLKLNQG